MNFPTITEYNPVYQKYIEIVERDNFFDQFDAITNETLRFFNSISTDKLNYRYAENKWTIKDVLMHIIDTERGFSYRTIVCIRPGGVFTAAAQRYQQLIVKPRPVNDH